MEQVVQEQSLYKTYLSMYILWIYIMITSYEIGIRYNDEY